MNKYGHKSVALGRGNSRCVHELVLISFVGPRPPGQEARHLNCDGSDNRLTNLVWGTKSENGKDVTRMGLRKLTYKQANEIRSSRQIGHTHQDIADAFDCSRTLVRKICAGELYVE